MIENMLFPIVRKKFPSSLKGELVTEQPMEGPELDVPKRKLEITGGLCHGWIEGFFFMPYELRLISFQAPKDPPDFFYITYTKLIEVLDTADTEELFEVKRPEWEKRIEEYGVKSE